MAMQFSSLRHHHSCSCPAVPGSKLDSDTTMTLTLSESETRHPHLWENSVVQEREVGQLTALPAIPERHSFQAASSSEAAGLISGASRNMAGGDAGTNGGRAVANGGDGKGLCVLLLCFLVCSGVLYPFENVTVRQGRRPLERPPGQGYIL